MTMRMKVLIGYDGSTHADAAIEDLRRAGLPRRVEALVVSVGEPPVVPPLESSKTSERAFVGERGFSIVNHADTHVALALADAKKHALAASRTLETLFPNWRVHAQTVGGAPATELIKKARDWRPDLIVVGSQGRSYMGRLILGSVSLEVATESPCSVRIGRASVTENPRDERRIVIGLDGLLTSGRAVEQVLKRAWPKGTELRIIAVADDQGPNPFANFLTRETRSEMIELSGATGLRVFAEIRKGDPATILMDQAGEWSADCIFIGDGGVGSTIDDSGSSVSKQLATNASCSIEIVR